MQASDNLPTIYNQYMDIKTKDQGDRLLREIQTNIDTLYKFKHLTKKKQERIAKGDKPNNKARLTYTNTFLRSLLERMTNHLDGPEVSKKVISTANRL